MIKGQASEKQAIDIAEVLVEEAANAEKFDIDKSLAPPPGVTEEIHEINVLLGGIILRARASYNWLNSPGNNILSARASADVMAAQVDQVLQLLRQIDSDRAS